MSEPKTSTHHNIGLTGEVKTFTGEVKTYFMQNGSLQWLQQGLGGIPIGMVIMIPMAPENWKKLSRDAQIKMLDELGILNP